MPNNEKRWTAEELAEMYQYTVETVWKRCRMYEAGEPGGWPHKRDGRSIRFTQADITAIDELMNPKPGERKPKRKRRSLAA